MMTIKERLEKQRDDSKKYLEHQLTWAITTLTRAQANLQSGRELDEYLIPNLSSITLHVVAYNVALRLLPYSNP